MSIGRLERTLEAGRDFGAAQAGGGGADEIPDQRPGGGIVFLGIAALLEHVIVARGKRQLGIGPQREADIGACGEGRGDP